MCEPTTILAAASLALTAIGGLQTAKAQKAAGEYQAQVANNNAKIAEWQAGDAVARGAEEEMKKRRETKALIGAQKAAYAASGVELGSGSPLDVLEGTAVVGEVDALTIRNNTAREAYGYRIQGVNASNEGRLALAKGKSQSTGTLLTTAASVSGQWAQGRQSGVL